MNSDHFKLSSLQSQNAVVMQSSEEAAQAISQLFNLSEVESAEFLTPRPGSTLLDVVGSPARYGGQEAAQQQDLSTSYLYGQNSQDLDSSAQFYNSPRQNQGDANQICYDFTKGKCGRGDKCKYSHDIATIIKFNSKEQGICFDYLRGNCDRGLLCKFSHDLKNITHLYQQASNGEVGNVNSTSICYNFLKGVCQKGNACRYSHDLRVIMQANSSQAGALTSSKSLASGTDAGATKLNAGDAVLALLQLLQGEEAPAGTPSQPQSSLPEAERPTVPKLPFTPELGDSGAKGSLQSPTDVLTYALSQQQLYPQQDLQGYSNMHTRSMSAGLDLDQLVNQLQLLQTLTNNGVTADDLQQAFNILQLSNLPSTNLLPRTTSGSIRPVQQDNLGSPTNMRRMYSQPLGSPHEQPATPAKQFSDDIWSMAANGNAF